MFKLVEVAIGTIVGLLGALLFLGVSIVKWFAGLGMALLLFLAFFNWAGWHMTHQAASWHALMQALQEAGLCAAIVAACQFLPFLLAGEASHARSRERYPHR